MSIPRVERERAHSDRNLMCQKTHITIPTFYTPVFCHRTTITWTHWTHCQLPIPSTPAPTLKPFTCTFIFCIRCCVLFATLFFVLVFFRPQCDLFSVGVADRGKSVQIIRLPLSFWEVLVLLICQSVLGLVHPPPPLPNWFQLNRCI